MSLAVKRALYRHGWDTRSRNLLPVHLLRPILGRAIDQCQNLLLDVGCGGFGLASFLPDVSVVGVDLETPSETVSNLKFRVGSVTSLPFPDRSFLVVSCIDVLEHLPEAERERAVRELVRVASETILIACPHGVIARRCDNEYR